VDALDAALNVGGGVAGVGSDAGGVSVGEGSISEGGLGLSLSLTLVDLADGGDGEGGGDLLEGSSAGSVPDGVVSIRSVTVSEGRLGLSFALAKVVSGVSVSVSVGQVAVAVSTVSSIGTVTSVGVGGNSVAVEERWVGLSLGGGEGSAGGESNNGLVWKKQVRLKLVWSGGSYTKLVLL
jgi:hypothetical protein